MNEEQMRARVEEIEAELREIHEAAGDGDLDEIEQRRWKRLTTEADRLNAKLTLHAAARSGHGVVSGDGADFSHERPARRASAHLTAEQQSTRSEALRGLEHLADADVLSNSDAKRLENWIGQSVETPARLDARRFALTATEQYERAFGIWIADPLGAALRMSPEELRIFQAANSQEMRATIETGTADYAVPPSIDPTVILTAAGTWNPFRKISRVVQVASGRSTIWEGVTSGGITASYDAEAAEVSDDSPTLTQPVINLEKAQSLVTFSIEAAQDWSNLQSEMAKEFADAKDRLEENKFAVGAGHSSHEPEGIITGATVNYTTLATSVTPALSDFTAMQDALDPRYEHDAVFVLNKKLLSQIRNLAVTAGYRQDYADISSGGERGNDQLSPLFGDPMYRATSISGAYGTAAESICVYGSFMNGYRIIDRIGMSVELVPHMFNTANNLPDGRRGLYCFWRNSAGVVNPDAFVVMKSSA